MDRLNRLLASRAALFFMITQTLMLFHRSSPALFGCWSDSWKKSNAGSHAKGSSWLSCNWGPSNLKSKGNKHAIKKRKRSFVHVIWTVNTVVLKYKGIRRTITISYNSSRRFLLLNLETGQMFFFILVIIKHTYEV